MLAKTSLLIDYCSHKRVSSSGTLIRFIPEKKISLFLSFFRFIALFCLYNKKYLKITTATRWNNLPIEILELIANALGDESKDPPYPTKWMLVKKQWLHLFQILSYKSTVLALSSTDKTLERILHPAISPPGEFVKSITFIGGGAN